MKPGQLAHSEKFSLYGSMSSVEIMDPKMDFKSNLSSEHTIQDLINKKKIKLPEELSVQEVNTGLCVICSVLTFIQLNGILDELMGQEFLWLKGLSLPHTVFCFR